MTDPDEVMAELEAEEKRLEALVQRSIQQKQDIREVKQALDELKENIEAEEGVRRNGAAADS